MTDLEQLEMILWIHAGGTKTHCSCGEYLAPETTPYLQRKHIAQAIIDAGWQAPEEIFKP